MSELFDIFGDIYHSFSISAIDIQAPFIFELRGKIYRIKKMF